MEQVFPRAAYLLLLAGLACIPFIAIGIRRRKVPGAGALGIMGLGVFLWTVTNALQLLGLPIPATVAAVAAFAGIGLLPPAWLSFSFESTGRRPPGPFLVLGVFMWLLTMAMVATNGSHNLVWRSVETGHGSVVTRWWYFWVFVSYSYGLVGFGVVKLLASTHRLPTVYKLQAIVMAVAGVIPVTVSALHVFGLLPRMPFDPTQLGFLASVALAGWALFRLRVLDLVPIQPDVLIERISEGVVVIDSQERILSLNRLGSILLGGGAPKAVGQLAGSVFPDWKRIRECRSAGADSPAELILREGASPLHLEITWTALTGPASTVKGQLLLLRDVTESRRREAERERLVAELQSALSQVKQLSGLLPICASCKRIRNDRGEWQQLESYVHAHSDARFSHGLCPICVSRFEDGSLPSN